MKQLNSSKLAGSPPRNLLHITSIFAGAQSPKENYDSQGSGKLCEPSPPSRLVLQIYIYPGWTSHTSHVEAANAMIHVPLFPSPSWLLLLEMIKTYMIGFGTNFLSSFLLLSAHADAFILEASSLRKHAGTNRHERRASITPTFHCRSSIGLQHQQQSMRHATPLGAACLTQAPPPASIPGSMRLSG